MKDFYRAGVLAILFLAGALLASEMYLRASKLECSTFCGCGADRGCTCVVATEGQCKCSDCNCQKEVSKKCCNK